VVSRIPWLSAVADSELEATEEDGRTDAIFSIIIAPREQVKKKMGRLKSDGHKGEGGRKRIRRRGKTTDNVGWDSNEGIGPLIRQ
jgi:hypothetical protein